MEGGEEEGREIGFQIMRSEKISVRPRPSSGDVAAGTSVPEVKEDSSVKNPPSQQSSPAADLFPSSGIQDEVPPTSSRHSGTSESLDFASVIVQSMEVLNNYGEEFASEEEDLVASSRQISREIADAGNIMMVEDSEFLIKDTFRIEDTTRIPPSQPQSDVRGSSPVSVKDSEFLVQDTFRIEDTPRIPPSEPQSDVRGSSPELDHNQMFNVSPSGRFAGADSGTTEKLQSELRSPSPDMEQIQNYLFEEFGGVYPEEVCEVITEYYLSEPDSSDYPELTFSTPSDFEVPLRDMFDTAFHALFESRNVDDRDGVSAAVGGISSDDEGGVTSEEVSGILLEDSGGVAAEGLGEGTSGILDGFTAEELQEVTAEELRGIADGELGAEIDLDDKEREFFSTDCCQRMCSTRFSKERIINARWAAMEENHMCNEHVNHAHLRILSQLAVMVDVDTEVNYRPKPTQERDRLTIKYMFYGQEVCRAFYLFANCCGIRRFKTLLEQFKAMDLSAHTHGLKGRRAHNTSDSQVITEFSTFMKNFTDVNALVLPGRTPYHSDEQRDLKLLPSSFTKGYVYSVYCSGTSKSLGFSTFTKYWREMFPNIVIQRPRTDLCAQCYQNTVSLHKLNSLSDEGKLALLKTSQDHLEKVLAERQLHQTVTKRIESPPPLGPSRPLSYRGTMHYSFDFAQQVSLPHDSQQVGPLYFLCPYKVALFGVACEPVGKFVLYVIPESVASAGKGSNIVISLLHHYFSNFGVGEEDLYCHADNCAGQNKNNYLMQYLVWRVMVGLNKSVKISFLPVGHTKFAPDLYFGVTKRRYRRSSVHSIQDFIDDISANCDSVIPVAVANEKGDLNASIYDWQGFFRPYATRITGIKDNYHFQTSTAQLGVLKCKKDLNSNAYQDIQIFEDSQEFDLNLLPDPIHLDGISFERQKYLFEKIRPYVRENQQDILCPKPVDDQREEDVDTVNADPGSSSSAVRHPPSGDKLPDKPLVEGGRKRSAYKCSFCHQTGHSNRVLKDGTYTCPKRRGEAAEPN